ncbi:asparagine synthase (glutamine-hydrolyzing) [Rhodoblastus acidophilus]|uniref:asparagine synthase (glutamine-hydrolyzing) n=1 Tax=Rhodoblastus acidophilus TaxID=1074 RepID=A0A6N8DUI7_RHOAC|nr:asparagine synthase (glutamine-hydrolyzing) [Rhodoblastus acidophilus]MCW2275850.1 asparagine synthase (glutamine-hydrolyzing) [Rhodoblastus acidophilus]MTV32504.1 asparagine synthase (glutamine-hydrolyzing) [Rhodoblastus acidophilus]
MCGIAGFLGRSADPAAKELAQRMISALAHRGPDGSGVHVDGPVALGHTRLSIIDLSGGHQPLLDESGDLAISFNGEIFNYVELRDALVAGGARFRTKSDTEVILELYRAKGEACVQDLNGDFAFALWDRRRQKLMLARDRMGVRPLYWTRAKNRLYFASEVKALLATGEVEARPDPIGLDQLFTLWGAIPPRTMFKGIQQLPPGHVMIATPDKVEIRRYWRLSFPTAAEDAAARVDEAALAEELRALLADATRIRLRSDVPVGAYLSGGLDSAITATLASDIVAQRLKTFSVTFESGEFDESAFQAQMAEALGTAHASIACAKSSIAAMFPGVIGAIEQPVLRTAPAPLYQLSDFVRQSGFKVVLTGEGADEVFAGYDIFREAKVRGFCARQPDSAWRPLLFGKLYPWLPGLQAQSPAYLKAFFGMALDRVNDPLFSHLPRFETTAKAKAFFSSDLKAALKGYDALAELRADLPAEFMRWTPLARAQYLETTYLLPGYILSAQGDRVAMAHGVEGRFPFLDHRVVEFGARVPARLKLKGLREKHILRESFSNRLPAAIGNRPKQPYRAPDSASFFGADAPTYVAERLSPASVASAGLFDVGAVTKLARKCAGGGAPGFRDNTALVGVLSGQLWSEQFFRGAAQRRAPAA